MSDRELIKKLAEAILELASKSAYEWDYDGEQMVATGISLDCEQTLLAIGEGE